MFQLHKTKQFNKNQLNKSTKTLPSVLYLLVSLNRENFYVILWALTDHNSHELHKQIREIILTREYCGHTIVKSSLWMVSTLHNTSSKLI